MENKELRTLVQGIIQEIICIAEKKGVRLSEDICERSITKANNFPYDARTSYQRDVALWPKPNEGDLYGGTILREGKSFGVPTPITLMVYSRILQFEGKK